MAHHREIARPKWAISELPSLSGKVAIVTGANSPDGIGYHIAHQLALKGAKVYLGARSLEKANDAIKNIIHSSSSLTTDSIHPLVMDLGNFKDVQKAAQAFVKNESRLDILVNNAGVLARPLDKDEHGISIAFGTNHLGPFLFTTELIPLLIKTEAAHPGVRVVNVASTSHFDVPEASFASLDDINNPFGSEDSPTSNYIRYGVSKLANILFSKELQRRFDEQGSPILVLSLHPGGVATNGAAAFLGGRDNDSFKSALSPSDGAITPLWAAAHPEPAQNRTKYAGAFLLPFGGYKVPSEQARDPKLAKQLWETSEKVLASVLN